MDIAAAKNLSIVVAKKLATASAIPSIVAKLLATALFKLATIKKSFAGITALLLL
ncbi:hypothetical protein FLA_1629 [Filimonas lacunae]|nr:hypothetical protein FLA_1629 [Filimonas lacunae]